MEAIEQIGGVAAGIGCQVFGAHYAEVAGSRPRNGDLYAFMALTTRRLRIHRRRRDDLAGIVTHHPEGCGVAIRERVSAPACFAYPGC